MKANIRRPSSWESIHVIGLDGFPIEKYQLDKIGNLTKKFKKLFPRKKNNIYQQVTETKSFFEGHSSSDLGDFPNTQENILHINNYTTENDDKKDDLVFFNSMMVQSSSEVIKSSNKKIITSEEIVSSPDKNANKMDFFELLSHQPDLCELFLGKAYDDFF